MADDLAWSFSFLREFVRGGVRGGSAFLSVSFCDDDEDPALATYSTVLLASTSSSNKLN